MKTPSSSTTAEPPRGGRKKTQPKKLLLLLAATVSEIAKAWTGTSCSGWCLDGYFLAVVGWEGWGSWEETWDARMSSSTWAHSRSRNSLPAKSQRMNGQKRKGAKTHFMGDDNQEDLVQKAPVDWVIPAAILNIISVWRCADLWKDLIGTPRTLRRNQLKSPAALQLHKGKMGRRLIKKGKLSMPILPPRRSK
jgi:hypothetical protein